MAVFVVVEADDKGWKMNTRMLEATLDFLSDHDNVKLSISCHDGFAFTTFIDRTTHNKQVELLCTTNKEETNNG